MNTLSLAMVGSVNLVTLRLPAFPDSLPAEDTLRACYLLDDRFVVALGCTPAQHRCWVWEKQRPDPDTIRYQPVGILAIDYLLGEQNYSRAIPLSHIDPEDPYRILKIRLRSGRTQLPLQTQLDHDLVCTEFEEAGVIVALGCQGTCHGMLLWELDSGGGVHQVGDFFTITDTRRGALVWKAWQEGQAIQTGRFESLVTA